MKNKQKKVASVSDSFPVAFAVELGSMYVECPEHELVRARRVLGRALSGVVQKHDDDDRTTGMLQPKPQSPPPSDLAAEAAIAS